MVDKKINPWHLMKKEQQPSRSHDLWAHFRFSVIGPLLAAPPERGQLQLQLQELAAKKWRHPIRGEWTLFGLSTLERWYYKVLGSKQGPVEVLKRKIRSDQGTHPALSSSLTQLLADQYRQHPSWSYQLHNKCGQLSYVASWVDRPSIVGLLSISRHITSHRSLNGLQK